MNSDIFKQFLQNVSEKIGGKEVLFIFDNAPCHNVDFNHLRNHHNVRKLPPWSPMFSPIEEVFSIWKFEIKRILAEADVRNELMNLGDNRQVTMIQWRKNISKREGLSALAVITQAKCSQFYNHSLLFLYKAIREIDL